MPGIAGIIGTGAREDNASALASMVTCMQHEAFYTSGTYTNERLGVWIGWVSHAGSFADCMPVWNEGHDVCLIFAGETFADSAERDVLRARGHEFEPDNASYLVHLYEEQGDAFLDGLNGWFHGLVVDLRAEKAILFNDRYGFFRINCYEHAGGLYFASEAKSLLKVRGELRRLDPRSMGEIFSVGCVLQDRTLFDGVSLAPGGSAWTFARGQSVRKRQYFRREQWEDQEPLDGAEYYRRLKETWAGILPRYFRGKEDVALSLTGGVDSRMILAWAPRSAGSLPCYTFGGRYRDCEDVRIARAVAAACGQPHRTIPVGREFLASFPDLAAKTAYLSDGLMDASGTIDVYVQRKAREIAPVRLTGTNGGEVLRRLVAFKPTTLSQTLFDPELARLTRDAAATYAGERQCHALSFTAFKQAPWYMNVKFAVERSQITFRTPYFDNDLLALLYRAPPDQVENNDLSLRLTAEGNPVLGRFATDRGIAASSIPGVTRARHIFQEFMFRAEYAYDYGMPQWLARFDHVAAALHLDRVFLGRHKFHHFRVWYRDELADFLKDVLLDPRAQTRPYLQRGCLEKMVRAHSVGHRNYTLEFHRLLTAELIQRQVIEQA